MDLKDIIKGKADMVCVKAGGVAIYELTSESGKKYQLEINLADTHDVGETATFMCHYDKAIILMRWIRKAIEKEELIELR